jgi:hypothetical protein
MNRLQAKILLLLITLPLLHPAFADDEPGYWRCMAIDSSKKHWMAKSNYAITAHAKAMEACKQESKAPFSCEADKEACDFIGAHSEENDDNDEQSHQHAPPGWRCTAIDDNAKSWTSQPSPHQDEAYLNAKLRCQQESKLPDTCSVNVLTCQ